MPLLDHSSIAYVMHQGCRTLKCQAVNDTPFAEQSIVTSVI